jgi:predicted AAA+ superfamily ATPase
MEILLEQSARLLAYTSIEFKRYLFSQINWNARLIGIKGSRGVGKTTLLLQYLKELELPSGQVAYFSLDDLFFTTKTLRETADQFYKHGGKIMALDEVHRYPNWSTEIKNIHDFYPDLQILFTGSSIIDIAKEESDLSRRVLMYDLHGLSFREYLSMKKIQHYASVSLEQLLFEPALISSLLNDGFKPLRYFQDYLQHGYYPFGVQEPEWLYQRINQVVRTIVEIDMAELPSFTYRNAKKLLQLVEVIAGQVPFKPNIKTLAEKTQIHRNDITSFLHFLAEAKIISMVEPAGVSTSSLQKPEKIYLQNTSLLYALAKSQYNIGTVRETFAQSMLSVHHQLAIPKKGDFIVDYKYTIEIGGATKKRKQLTEIENAWIVRDDIEIGSTGIVPLWSLGMLY